MKNKKGFTFIELLVVVALLGLIVTVAAPSIIKSVRKTNKRLCYNKSALILSAAELYAQDTGIVGNNILVSSLISSGYLEPDEEGTESCPNGCVIEPLTKTSLNDKKITIEKKGGKTYKATWQEEGIEYDICYEE